MSTPTEAEVRKLLDQAVEGWKALLYLAEYLGHGDRNRGLQVFLDMLEQGEVSA